MTRSGEAASRGTRLLLELWAAAYKSFKIYYFRYAFSTAVGFLSTPIWILVIFYPVMLFLPEEKLASPTTYEEFFWALVSWDFVSLALWGVGNSLRSEQYFGTLEYLLLTNARRPLLFSGSLLPNIPMQLLDIAYLALLFRALFGTWVAPRDPLLLAVAFALCLATAYGLGLVYAAIVLHVKSPGA